ncbi:MAG: glycosyltransferase family 9 protein, partial [Proteobacteria bacterium]|nr:glycosyltransferase family 9 protein [Pseudomonadota bacterium]
ENILVIKLGALGDFVQALGPMAAIRRHHPKASITLLTAEPFSDLGRACGYFDVVEIDRKPRWDNISGWLALRGFLNKNGFSRIYDLQNSDRTSLYFRLLKKPRPQWVGAARGASHRNASSLRTAGRAFDGHVQTLAAAGIHDVSEDDLSWAKGNIEAFQLKEPYVLLVPGSAPDRLEKRWPVERYAALAQHFFREGYLPVILGSARETALAEKIRSICPEARDLTGRTDFPDVFSLARRASATVGNDTGPMHMIALAGCPSLVLFSRHSDPAKHGPTGKKVTTLRKKNLADIAVEDVIAAADPMCARQR